MKKVVIVDGYSGGLHIPKELNEKALFYHVQSDTPIWEEIKSKIEDLDFAEAVSDLAYESFVLEAAQQSFVRINGLSLFNRL